MNNKGHISLNRRIRNHWIWKDPVKLRWWIDILLDVNWKPDSYLVDGKFIKCGRGQSVKSIHTWAQKWNVDRNVARKFFRLLSKHGMISIEPLKRTSRVTVLQYGMYQQQSTQLTNSKSSSCKDAVPNPYPTCEENRTQLINSDSESCKDVVPYLQKYMYPNRINEEVFKGKNSLEIKSSSSEQDVGPQSPKVEVPEEKKESENLDKKFELFTESEEAEVLLTDIVPQNKQTPHDPTH